MDSENTQHPSNSKTFPFFLIAAAIAMLALVAYGFIQASQRNSSAKASPPQSHYSGELVETPKMAECLVGHVSSGDLQWMREMGVHKIEGIRTNPTYRSCILHNDFSCGWFVSHRVEVSDSQGRPMVDYATPLNEGTFFGMKVTLEGDHVRAYVPAPQATPDTDFIGFCAIAGKALMQEAVNALSWTPAAP